MKLIKSLSIIFIAFILMASGCSKQSASSTNQLPPATNQGLNTFGCLVNGQVFVPQAPIGYPYPYYTCYIYPNTTNPNFSEFTLSGEDKSNGGFTAVGFTLDSINLQQGDTFQLKSIGGGNYATYTNANTPGYINYYTTDTLTGQLIITYLDKTNYIVSGTFLFNAVSANASDTVHITEGRFDMLYK
jgi:hypothetical protein